MSTASSNGAHRRLIPIRSLPEVGRLVSLPLTLTSFVGGERELVAVGELLRRSDVRPVTLTGPIGVGKTRLAIRAVEQVAADFPRQSGLWRWRRFAIAISQATNPAGSPNTVIVTFEYPIGVNTVVYEFSLVVFC